jgi:hypothetical protein
LRTLIPPQNDAYDAVLDDAESSPHDAALGILRELGSADEIVWRNECETYGYYFEPDEFREIVEELVTDGLVRVHYEDPAWVGYLGGGEAADPVSFGPHPSKQLGDFDLVAAPVRHPSIQRVDLATGLPEVLEPGQSRPVPLAVANLNMPDARGLS